MKPTHLSAYIRARRLKLGLTQREVGAALGYTSQFVTNWERGASAPPTRILSKLCRVLETAPDTMRALLVRDADDFYCGVLFARSNFKHRSGLYDAPKR